MTQHDVESYGLAQEAVCRMKEAVLRTLKAHPEGLRNSELGRLLGVNADFLGDQQGWFCYTILKIMELERIVEQPVPKGPWVLRNVVKISKEPD